MATSMICKGAAGALVAALDTVVECVPDGVNDDGLKGTAAELSGLVSTPLVWLDRSATLRRAVGDAYRQGHLTLNEAERLRRAMDRAAMKKRLARTA